MSGKGSKRRPQQISNAEADIRWQLLSANEIEKKYLLDKLEEIRKQNLNKEGKV